MAVKRKPARAAKPAPKKKSSAKAARKTTSRKSARPAKHPAAKRKPARKPKSTMEKAEAAIVEIAKSIVPSARKAIKSVTRSIAGKKQ
jgi:hypothetical protein